VPTCRSCGAEIFWATTLAGRSMPIDPIPLKRIILGPPSGESAQQRCKVIDTYESHYATCPNALEHRKKNL